PFLPHENLRLSSIPGRKKSLVPPSPPSPPPPPPPPPSLAVPQTASPWQQPRALGADQTTPPAQGSRDGRRPSGSGLGAHRRTAFFPRIPRSQEGRDGCDIDSWPRLALSKETEVSPSTAPPPPSPASTPSSSLWAPRTQTSLGPWSLPPTLGVSPWRWWLAEGWARLHAEMEPLRCPPMPAPPPSDKIPPP
ncbi:unnamed protein product, partial [Urochloa humidicola]